METPLWRNHPRNMEKYDELWEKYGIMNHFSLHIFSISEMVSVSQTRKNSLATTTNPICSMYVIFTHIWVTEVNVGKYTIHGVHGVVDTVGDGRHMESYGELTPKKKRNECEEFMASIYGDTMECDYV